MIEKIKKLKPLGWKASLLIFLITATILYITHYIFAVSYKLATGSPYLIGYLIGWTSTMFLVFAVSLAAYKLEGHPFNRETLARRFRLRPMNRADWIWTLAIIVLSIAGLAAFSFTQKWLISMPLTAPHPVFPPDLVDPVNNRTQGILFEMPLMGKWWIVGVYFMGWVFNTLGEEFWYRGWMLPKQELAFGKHAWVVNGLMFNFQHTLHPWNFLAMLPGSLLVSYVVQRRGNTWLSIIWHGLLNFSPLLFIINGVIA